MPGVGLGIRRAAKSARPFEKSSVAPNRRPNRGLQSSFSEQLLFGSRQLGYAVFAKSNIQTQ
jgi:hypothetical protein